MKLTEVTVVDKYQIRGRDVIATDERCPRDVMVERDQVLYSGKARRITGIESHRVLNPKPPFGLLCDWDGESPPVGAVVTIAQPGLEESALMNEELEKAFMQGNRAAWRLIFVEAQRHLLLPGEVVLRPIACSERMPEPERRVLAFVPSQPECRRWRMAQWCAPPAQYTDAGWRDEETLVGDVRIWWRPEQVTHWMPLPGEPA